MIRLRLSAPPLYVWRPGHYVWKYCNGASWTGLGAQGGSVTDLRAQHWSPTEVKCLSQEVRPSFNKYMFIPSYPGHMLAWRSAVMAGQVSRQMRKWWEAGGLSCLVSSSITPPPSSHSSPAVFVAVCGVVLIRPVSADTQHTVLQPCMANSPPASLSLSVYWGRAGEKSDFKSRHTLETDIYRY